MSHNLAGRSCKKTQYLQSAIKWSTIKQGMPLSVSQSVSLLACLPAYLSICLSACHLYSMSVNLTFGAVWVVWIWTEITKTPSQFPRLNVILNFPWRDTSSCQRTQKNDEPHLDVLSKYCFCRMLHSAEHHSPQVHGSAHTFSSCPCIPLKDVSTLFFPDIFV